MRPPGQRAAVALLGAAVLLAGCTGDGSAGVRVATVSRGAVTEVVEAPATVTARATASVSAAAGGTVARLWVREGDQVRAGQLLLRVESPQARRALRQARSADRQAASAGAGAGAGVPTLTGATQADATARAAFERARRTAGAIADPAARAQALAALRVTLVQYEAARASADLAAAQLAAGLGSLSAAVSALSSAQRVQTRAAVELARRTMAALTVRAPVAGTVSLTPGESAAAPSGADELLSQLPDGLQSQAGQALGGTSSVSSVVALGAPVTSGQPLVSVTDTSTLSLTAQVDETDVLLVDPGVEATVELDAVPDSTYAATVTTVDPTPTTSTRGGVSYLVRLSLGPGTGADGGVAPRPRPGMSAVADLRVRTSRGVVAVPASAVFRDGRRDAVYVEVHGVARRRLVRLGAQGESRVEVLEGLTEGERLVVHGVDRVRGGQRLP